MAAATASRSCAPSAARPPADRLAGPNPARRSGHSAVLRWPSRPLTTRSCRGETLDSPTRPEVTQMKARYLVPIAAASAAGLLAGCGDGSDTTTIKLIEHAETDVVRHIGPAKEEDSAGDVLAFANPVFDEGNEKQVGTDNGHCVRTAPGKAWECIWTVS